MGTRAGGGSDFRRTAGMAGAVSAVLLVIGLILTFAQGAPPALDGSSQDIARYFTDNEGLARLAAAFNFLPILTLPIFFAGVYLLFRDGRAGVSDALPATDASTGTAGGLWPRVALIAFIALGVFSTIQGAAAFAIALGAQDEFGGTPAVAGALFDFYNALGPGSALSMALLLWAVGNCHARTRDDSPDWLKTVLYLGAAAAALSFFAPFLEMDALAYAGLIAFIVFIVWVAVVGLGFLRIAGDRATRGRGSGI